MIERTGSTPARRIASSAAVDDPRMLVDHRAHVAVGLLHLDRDPRTGLALLDLRRRGRCTSSRVPLEESVVVVADDQRDDGFLDRRGDARGMDESLAPLGRLG